MKRVIYYTGLVFIAIFLFATHSKFLFILEPEKNIELFSFFGIDFKEVIPYIFGMAFGVVTAILIGIMQKGDKLFWYFAIAVAIFEMIGIFLYNNTEIVKNVWRWFASIYYALYSGFIVFMYSYISHNSNDENENENEFEQILNQAINESQNELYNEKFIEGYVAGERLKEGFTNSNDKTKITKQTRNEKILKMAEIMSPEQIAKEFAINKSTVYRIIKKGKNVSKNKNNN